MNLGLDEHHQQGTNRLDSAQKWSVVAAAFVFIQQILLIIGWLPYTNAFRIVSIVIAIGKVFSCFLILVPSCSKDPQVACKWRFLVFPFIGGQIGYVIFIFAFYVYFHFRYLGTYDLGSAADKISICLTEIALSIALVACAMILLRHLRSQRDIMIQENLQLQSYSLVANHNPQARSERHGTHGRQLVQKWSIAAIIFVLFNQIFLIIKYIFQEQEHLDVTVFRVIALFLATGKIISCLLMLVPSCTKRHQTASKWRVLVFPFILVHLEYMIYIFAYYVYYRFKLFRVYDVSEIAYYILYSFLAEIALCVVLIACAFFLMRRFT